MLNVITNQFRLGTLEGNKKGRARLSLLVWYASDRYSAAGVSIGSEAKPPLSALAASIIS